MYLKTIELNECSPSHYRFFFPTPLSGQDGGCVDATLDAVHKVERCRGLSSVVLS